MSASLGPYLGYVGSRCTWTQSSMASAAHQVCLTPLPQLLLPLSWRHVLILAIRHHYYSTTSPLPWLSATPMLGWGLHPALQCVNPQD